MSIYSYDYYLCILKRTTITYPSAHAHITIQLGRQEKGNVGGKREKPVRKMFNKYVDFFIDIKTIVQILYLVKEFFLSLTGLYK